MKATKITYYVTTGLMSLAMAFSTFASAFIAHTVVGDPTFNRVYPLFILSILVVSYVAYQKLSGCAVV